MADIKASVGANGQNQHDDVEEIQALLNTAPVSAGGPEPMIDIDGWCGAATKKAILDFQRFQKLPVADGRVDPGKSTIKRLNEVAQGPGTRTVALPDMAPADLARLGVPQAMVWANAGLAVINKAIVQLNSSGGISGLSEIERTALAAHFKIEVTMTKQRLKSLLDVVFKNYTGAQTVLNSSATMFRSVTRQQMSQDFRNMDGAPGYVMPGNRTRVNWTPLFRVRSSGPRPGRDWTGDGFGPKCRAAMVLHEPIHIVDSRGGLDIYEHGPAYLTMTADQAVHNAASYPSFGAHVAESSTTPLGPRYGAGRPEI